MLWLKSFIKSLSLLTVCLTLNLEATTAKNTSTATVKKADQLKPFTGKISANKVRLRIKADLDSPILRQMNKNELLLVVGEEGDFYAVEPPKDTKAYVFRSYILDDTVEANRVNIRLEPHPDAPVIGQLEAGNKVKGQVCALNHKWLEIAAPSHTRFYVSKEFLIHAGPADFLATMERRKSQVEELLNSAFLLAETECKKPYTEMSPSSAIDKFQTVLTQFADFPEAALQAKEALALLKDTYLNKKIAYLESKAELSPTAKEELISKHKQENSQLFADTKINPDPNLWNKRQPKKELTDAARLWDTLEESLFLSWTAFHSGKKLDDFYEEQKANAAALSGTIEHYNADIKDKPGNFLLRCNDKPVAYLYSTQVDLEQYIDQNVTVMVSPRPNNHFAFPAYFVFGVQ
jgi:uncharacterized protein YgiM (DUF1202 family)